MTDWEVDEATAGARLDAAVAGRLGVGVNQARRLIGQGFVLVDGKPGSKGDRLRPGARVEVRAAISVGERVIRRDVPLVPELGLELEVLYEDEALLAINKPAGRHTHPLRLGELGTVANALAARYPACAAASLDEREGGLAHRLDRDTTGVLIAAKTRAAYEALRAAFAEGQVEKTYWALVHGVPAAQAIDAPLVTRGGLAKIAPADPEALPARTEVRPLVAGAGHALVEARARTGRLHQVRAHLAHVGHPLYGDTRYGAPREMLDDHPLLHARALSLPHPVDGWRLTCVAPVPEQRRTLMERLLGAPLPER